MAETERKRLERRAAEMKRTRSSWEVNWRGICDAILPYRARWSNSKHNQGESLMDHLINSTPHHALRTNSAGMMASITSPSRPWFHLTTSDKELNQRHAVKSWLDTVERIIRETVLQSHFYQAMAGTIYRDLGLIGTAAMIAEEDPELGIRFEGLPIGEYYLDVNAKGDVDTCLRERPMTVRNVVQKFGLENVSEQTKIMFNRQDFESVITVFHLVYPNSDLKPGKLGAQGMPWASRWWEKGDPSDKFLRTGGYHEFPIMAPRWNVLAGEIYGRSSPGWETRGDAQALQHLENRLARLVDKSSDPPMRGSDALRSARASLLSGDITYVPNGQGHMFEPAMQVNPQSIVATERHIERHERRIERGWYVDLWTALLSDTRAQRATATEIERTREEVMLQLGPLLENLNIGLLDPAIERTYAVLLRQGRLPPPPPELQGTEGAVRIEFISVLHQAQKLTSMVGIREFITQALTLAGAGIPDGVEKLQVGAIMDELANILGVKPDLVVSKEDFEAMKEARAQQEQAQQQGQAMLQATEGIRNMGNADPQKMGELASLVSPAAAAQGGLG